MNAYRTCIRIVAIFMLGFLPAGNLEANVLGIEDFQTEGIRFLLAEDHSIPNIYLGVAFHPGGISDPPGKEGLTNIMLEMLQRGTATRTRQQISENIEFMGSNLNSIVGYSSMGLSGETLTRHLDDFVSIYGDVLLHPGFAQDELERLKQEITDQLKQNIDDDYYLVARAYQERMFRGSLFARSVRGSIKSVSSITVTDIKNHYKALIQKGAAIVFAAGDINRTTLEQKMAPILMELPEGEGMPIQSQPLEPLEGRHLIVIDKPNRSQCELMLGHRLFSANSPDYFKILIAHASFGGSFKSRYSEEIRFKRGWTYGARGSMDLHRTAGAYTLSTSMEVKNLAATVKHSIAMLGDLAKDGITKQEFDKSESLLVKRFPFKIDTTEKRIMQRLNMIANDLPADHLENYRRRVNSTSLADVNRATAKYVDDKNLVIVAICEAKSCRAELQKAIESLDSTTVVPYDKM